MPKLGLGHLETLLEGLDARTVDFTNTSLTNMAASTFASTLGIAGLTSFTGNTGLSPGTGITAGVGTVYHSWREIFGAITKTSIYIDLTGMSSNEAGDIIGKGAGTANCHIGQYTTAVMGTLFAGRMTCLETPDTGEPDIDLVSGDEATGAEDVPFGTALTNQATLLAAGADWVAGLSAVNSNLAGIPTMPGVNQYMYLTGGGGTTDAVYDKGQFLIEFWGVTA